MMTKDQLGMRSKVGKRLAEARKEKGISQYDLADLIGVQQPVVALYESGKKPIPMFRLPEVARVLGVSIDSLMFDDWKEKNDRIGRQSKLELQLEQIRKLPKEKQKAISTVLDMALQNV
jgi:transcriptional regulator with XRE-family HTH domain